MSGSINLGYACINMHLSETQKNTPARTCRKATFAEKGLPHVGMLFEQNIRNLHDILKWNASNDFTLYRMSSDMAPWCSEYNLEDLPNWQTCKVLLEQVGAYARETGQRADGSRARAGAAAAAGAAVGGTLAPLGAHVRELVEERHVGELLEDGAKHAE